MAVDERALLVHQPPLQDAKLRVFRFPPGRCQTTTLATKIARASPRPYFAFVSPQSNVRRPVVIVRWRLGTNFHAHHQAGGSGAAGQSVRKCVVKVATPEPHKPSFQMVRLIEAERIVKITDQGGGAGKPTGRCNVET